ncbi:nucleotide sugar dehydrogenase [Citricoccus muralis]|uniref:Nucleotide sugar dehydrogenase n=1 Tax=Citricoccus muralis TaxID=169134 RepID=A0A3D9LEA8_9MICC|nr:nucleotide sugar dehydrogenase [Citricoccus muralis]REE03777.1 nucleotide sugar dehydrogenase [Citricoccus muralis]
MSKTVVIGQGYVGLPLAKEAALGGLSVVGLDLNTQVVDDLNSGRSHVDDISDSEVQEMLRLGYVATSDPHIISEASTVIICVPTPLGDNGSPDLGAVVGATKSIASNLKPGTTVVLESTTYPGTTESLVLPILRESGLELDRDFWLAFSPERIDPGNSKYGLRNTPKVVGGVSAKSTVAAVNFYDQVVDKTVPVRSSREAETAKLLENTYRHINIALVNEMAKFCHELEIDLWDVIEAARTKPFGFQAFYPGPGVGGHCIPIDPNYLSYEVERRLGYPFRFVELAQEINNSMPRYVVSRAQDLLNQHSKALRGAKILLLGVTYKADIADERESPAVPIASLLAEKGVELLFHDPKIKKWNIDDRTIESVSDIEAAIADSDLCILLQAHGDYDVDSLARKSRLFLDTRGKVSRQIGNRL